MFLKSGRAAVLSVLTTELTGLAEKDEPVSGNSLFRVALCAL
jgi:hypothetical protein